MTKKKEKTCYLIHYRDPQDGQHQSIKACKITDSPLGLSFIAISEFIFETEGILVNPDEEAKKLRFEDTKTFHLSIYSVLSVSEVGAHKKSLHFKNDKAKLLTLNTDYPAPTNN